LGTSVAFAGSTGELRRLRIIQAMQSFIRQRRIKPVLASSGHASANYPALRLLLRAPGSAGSFRGSSRLGFTDRRCTVPCSLPLPSPPGGMTRTGDEIHPPTTATLL